MPRSASALAVPFQKDLFGEVPDVFRAPEIGEQFAKRDRRDQLVEALRRGRVRVLVVRFFFGSGKEFDRHGAGILDAPGVRGAASAELVGVEKSLDEDGAVLGECFSFRCVHC